METDLSSEGILEIALAFRASRVLISAAELDLFTELSGHALDAETIRQRLGLHPRGTRDFLDTLVSLGLLGREGGLYSNSSEADYFLDRSKPSYIGGMLEMANARISPSWSALTEALKTGLPQSGAATFDALYSDPKRLRFFLQAMTAQSRQACQAIAEKFPWEDYRSFVDLGTALGGLPAAVCQTHDHLEAGGFDLPVVEPLFMEYIQARDLSERVRFHAGDFFEDPLPEADVYVLGHILHDWNLEKKKALLEKVCSALPPGGALIVYESLIDDDRKEHTAGLLMSLNMLVVNEGGFDFTGADCREWMAEAGFRESRVEHLAGSEWMVVGIK